MIPALVLTALLSSFPGVKVMRVIDGDTFVVNLPNEPEVFGQEISVRIAGINTAELHDTRKCAKASAEAAKARLTQILSNTRVDLLDCGRDKFFRILCIVSVSPGIDVADAMIGMKLAVPYFGETKEAWNCRL